MQATKLPGSSEKKEATAGATSLPVEVFTIVLLVTKLRKLRFVKFFLYFNILALKVNNAPVVSLKEKLKSLREGPGSMALYLELREKQQIEKEIPRAESQTQHLQSQSGNLLDHMHVRVLHALI